MVTVDIESNICKLFKHFFVIQFENNQFTTDFMRCKVNIVSYGSQFVTSVVYFYDVELASIVSTVVYIYSTP